MGLSFGEELAEVGEKHLERESRIQSLESRLFLKGAKWVSSLALLTRSRS